MKINDLTPEAHSCSIGLCPRVLEIRELTPEQSKCVIGGCPRVYEKKELYLIIGRQINPRVVGLDGKMGEDEALVAIPKEIIDKMKRPQ
jgi:hypothetical protein